MEITKSDVCFHVPRVEVGMRLVPNRVPSYTPTPLPVKTILTVVNIRVADPSSQADQRGWIDVDITHLESGDSSRGSLYFVKEVEGFRVPSYVFLKSIEHLENMRPTKVRPLFGYRKELGL